MVIQRERERLLMMLVEVSVSHKHISLPSITHNMFSSKLGVSKGSYFLIKSAFLELAKLPSSSPFIVMPTLPHLAGESAHTHAFKHTLTASFSNTITMEGFKAGQLPVCFALLLFSPFPCGSSHLFVSVWAGLVLRPTWHQFIQLIQLSNSCIDGTSVCSWWRLFDD